MTSESNVGTVSTRNVYFAAYNTSGRIVRHGVCTEDALGLQEMDDSLVLIDPAQAAPDLDSEFYVRAGQLAKKAELACEAEYIIAADGAETVTFDLPPGTTITFQGQNHDAEASFGFVSDQPGDFEFFIWPPASYRDKKVTIHAV